MDEERGEGGTKRDDITVERQKWKMAGEREEKVKGREWDERKKGRR